MNEPTERITCKLRLSNSVLEDEDFTILSLTLDQDRIAGVSILHSGCYGIPGLLRSGASIEALRHWLSYDGTGTHPEEFNEIYDPSKKDWVQVFEMEDLRKVLSLYDN